jgi:signal transduction histidine kinase
MNGGDGGSGGNIFSAIRSYCCDHAPLLLLHLDAGGRAVDANRFARERLAVEWRGKTLGEFFLFTEETLNIGVMRNRPEQVHLMSAATAAGLPETFRVRFYAVGEETLVFGSLDADETMVLRRELINLNNALNSLTRELQKKNHELAELNRLKNQFLGMAAHDLRKPVSAILSYTEFLMDEAGPALDREQAGFLKTIHGSTKLMRGVIDDFLDISMIEAGRFDIKPSAVDLRRIVETSVELNRLLAQKRGVSLVVVQDGDVPAVMADPVKIEQVLNNLISNAVEHSPPDERVHIRITADESAVVAAVSDSGPGIAPETIETLFTPFARGGTAKPVGTKNMGLGLAISKKIVEAHGGEIWVEDKPGGGTVFAFRLPFTLNPKGEIQ